jgi:hypothetical protein
MKAILRDGSFIEIGNEVQTDFYKSCIGLTFVVEQITPHDTCESGFLVVAALKEDRSKKLLGFKKEGFTFKDGLDANHFRKITADPGPEPAETPAKEKKEKAGKKSTGLE